MGAPPPTPTPRPPLVRHPGRVAIVVGTLAVVVTLLVWVGRSAKTDPGPGRNQATLPSAVESVSPGPGELSGLQATITVDLRDDLTGVLVISPPDRPTFEVPEDQTERVVPLGQLAFRTGPDQELSRLESGPYTITVLYWPQDEARPEQPAGFTWEFRAGA